jgi:hypothetical protein
MIGPGSSIRAIETDALYLLPIDTAPGFCPNQFSVMGAEFESRMNTARNAGQAAPSR